MENSSEEFYIKKLMYYLAKSFKTRISFVCACHYKMSQQILMA